MGEQVTSFLWFIGINLEVFLSTGLLTLACLKFRVHDWVKALIVWFVLIYTFISLSQIGLGAAGILSFSSLFALHTAVVTLILSLIGPKVIKHWKEVDQSGTMKPVDWFKLCALFVPFLLLAIVRFFNAALQVPVEYDNLAYHLPFVVEWMRSGDLMQIYYSAYAGPLGYYPSNYELLDLWAMLPLHGDLLINLLNIPVFLLLPITLYKVAKNFAIKSNPALLIVALFLMMPVTLRQLGTPLVDLYFTLTFIFGVYFLQEFRKSKSLVDVALAGLSLGLFAGTKYLGIVYVVPLLVVFLLYLIFTRITKVWQWFSAGTILALTTFMTGAFWYIRNWINSGNPLFPTEVKLGGEVLFQGYSGITDNLVETSLVTNIPFEKPIAYFFDRFFLMVGAQSYVFIVAAVLMVGLIVWKLLKGVISRQKDERKRNLIRFFGYTCIVGAILVYLAGYWLSPYSFKDLIPNVRYALPFLVFAMLMLGIVMSEVWILQPIFYFIGFSVIIYNFVYLVLFPPLSILTNERLVLDYYQLSAYSFELLLFIVLGLGCMGLFFALKYMFKQPRFVFLAILLIANITILSHVFFRDTGEIRETTRSLLYYDWYSKNTEWLYILDASEWLNTYAHDAKVAYIGFNFHYPLFGRKLEREVHYVNVNSCLECRYVDYKDEPESIRANPSYNAWRRNLRSYQKEYVVVKDVKDRMYELAWMQERPEEFQEVFRRGDVYIYHVIGK